MATPCPPPCGDITWEDWIKKSELERQFILLCAIQTGPIEPIAPPAPDFGTTAFTGLTNSNGEQFIPAGWSSFTVSNLITSLSNIDVNGVSVPPGMSISHGTWDGFSGDTVAVNSPDVDTVAILTWTIPTPTP